MLSMQICFFVGNVAESNTQKVRTYDKHRNFLNVSTKGGKVLIEKLLSVEFMKSLLGQ